VRASGATIDGRREEDSFKSLSRARPELRLRRSKIGMSPAPLRASAGEQATPWRVRPPTVMKDRVDVLRRRRLELDRHAGFAWAGAAVGAL